MLAAVRALLFPPACAACDAPGPGLCAACAPPSHAAERFSIGDVPAYALGPYEGALRTAIVAMKRGLRDPLDAFAALLDGAPVRGVLVPLPTTRGRVAARGFDQAVELARRVARRRGLMHAAVLRKTGAAQERRDRSARLVACGRFSVRRGGAPLPPCVTVLDDVTTTGATVRDACAALRAAGIEVAGAVLLARTAEPRTVRGGR